MREFDYVIVGAGSAGCVLANRLSADPEISVALVEAGGWDRHPFIHMPRGVVKLMRLASYMWFYLTQPTASTAMRPDIWMRGKGVGGSSSVNGMVWVRGEPADYDRLAALTSGDWSWEHFARAYEDIEAHQLGAAPTRGGSGPLHITLPRVRNALTQAIVQAGEAMGWPNKDDVNMPGDGQGVGLMPRSIWRGRRQSAAVAFLRPVARRKNLTLFTHSVTQQVNFDGTRATGVTIQQGDKSPEIRARREVIISAGAVASPGILERSGVGDPGRLKEHGIPPVIENLEVGDNASEHRAMRMQWRLKKPLSQNREYSGWKLVFNVLRYYLTHSGPMTGAAIDMRAAFRSNPELDNADIQVQIGLYSWDMESEGGALETDHGFCAVLNPISPISRGSVHIGDSNPHTPPLIYAGYGECNEDREKTVIAARRLREWASQEPLARLIETELAPGPDANSDEDFLAVLDRHGCAGMHTVGTCRMGKDQSSVVDPLLRVRGAEALRIVDASVFPFIPSGNTNAPTIALAWLAADIIFRGAQEAY